MKSKSLKGEIRKETGKKNASLLRKENKIPCVLYGTGENVHFAINAIAFDKIVNSPDVYFVEIDMDNGKKVKTIIQEIQSHPVTDAIIHVDFIEVVKGKPFTIDLPVRTVGTSSGVIKGGKLRTVTRKLKVRGLAEDILDAIECDITKLEIGDSIKVKDINIKGLQILNAEDAVIVAVRVSRVAILEEEGAEEGEEGAEGEDKKEEATEGAKKEDTPA